MMSLSIVKRLSPRKKVIWALVIAFVFSALSLPRTNQAQNGFFGPVVDEAEPNDLAQPGQIQRLRDFPVVVRGNSEGKMAPTFEVFPVDIPPIIDPRTGSTVGTPRQTQVIRFRNRFLDRRDFYLFRLMHDANIAINLSETGGFHDLSGDAQLLLFGLIFPIPPGPVVSSTDLDIVLFNQSLNFIDGSFAGLGFNLLGLGGAGFINPFDTETIPNPELAFQGNPEFVPTVLGRGSYVVLVNDFTKFSLFVTDVGPNQNPNTGTFVYAWDTSTDNPYILRLGSRDVSAPSSGDEDIVPPKGAVKFIDRYTTAQHISGAADDYYVFKVINPGRYTFNLSMGSSEATDSGRLFLLRLDEASKQWVPVGQSTVVSGKLESLSDVALNAGRYMIAVMRDGIKPIANKYNYFIGVLDEVGQPVGMELSQVINLNETYAKADALKTLLGVSGKDNK